MASELRVYIVDDSPSARLALGRLLAVDGGIEVVGQAASGRRALDEIPRIRPDVVLMDVLMLGLSGIETTRQLMQRHPVPIVLISDAIGAQGLNFEGLAAGAVDLMRKPSAREIADASVAGAWARRLRSLAKVPVVTPPGARIITPTTGDVPEPGLYYFAPDERHLSWSQACLHVSSDSDTRRPCPSIDALFSSLARAAIGERTVGALLTGMGQDGAAGLLELRNVGAWTIAESETSCVIHGMSRVAEEIGGACEVLDLDGIIRRLQHLGYG